MRKVNIIPLAFLIFFCFFAATYLAAPNPEPLNQKYEPEILSVADIKSLETHGFTVEGEHIPARSPRLLDSTNLPETAHIKMSLDVRKAKNLEITWLNAPATQKITDSQIDTILAESFEGDFPGTIWQLSGNPTWGKSTYTKHGGQNSVFCAKSGSAGVTPPANYPNNMNAMMVFGPFDLSNASLAIVRFWYWLETEINKDWFWYMASIDGVNFGGIGVSGSTGITSPAWEQTLFNLANVPQLGSLIGQSSVWIAFGFTSDATGVKRGVFVDDVAVQKAAIGTGISGYLKGSLRPAGNPFIAFDHIGVAAGDTLSIMPGTEIRFEQGKEFAVDGLLLAQGTVMDSIIFTSNSKTPKPKDWLGIGFYFKTSPKTIIQFARIEYGGSHSASPCGIYSESAPQIKNNLIISNGSSGVKCVGHSLIVDNKISDNFTGVSASMGSQAQINGNIIFNNVNGISVWESKPIIRNNKIFNNNTGISGLYSESKIIKNLIQGNRSFGISCDNSMIVGNEILDNGNEGIYATYGVITQNIIKGNREGINGKVTQSYERIPHLKIFNNIIIANSEYGMNFYLDDLKYTQIINNIVTKNGKAGIYAIEENPSVSISHNNIFDNVPNYQINNQPQLGRMAQINANGDSVDIYYNLSQNPLFLNPDINDFHLQYVEAGFALNSPCRDAGKPLAFYNDWDGTPDDMGAYGGTGIGIYPFTYDFGKQIRNLDRNTSFSFINARDSSFVISNATLSDATNFYLTQHFPITISSYSELPIEVHMKARGIGKLRTTLTLYSPDFLGTDSCSIEIQGESLGGTVINGGSIWGTWSRANSPYYISGSVDVPPGKVLNIEAGVQILCERASFGIYGGLNAIGAPQDSILLTSYRPELYSSSGLIFMNADIPCQIKYCRIEYGFNTAGGGIQCQNSSLTISNSLIRNCHGSVADNAAGGIYCRDATLIVMDTRIENNDAEKAGGISCINSSATIKNCVIRNNYIFHSSWDYSGGITFVNSDGAINNNVIVGNKGSAVLLEHSFAEIRNNIISRNSGVGIYIRWKKFPTANSIVNIIENNTITGNAVCGLLFDDADSCRVKNCIVWDNNSEIQSNLSEFAVTYSNIRKPFTGIGNISIDPHFIDLEHLNFYLQPISPCIDSGDPFVAFNDPEDCSQRGFALTPAQGTLRNDMGAYGGPGIVGNLAPCSFSLLAPDNEDTLTTQTPIFQWEKARDPNPGNQVFYTLQVDLNKYFASASNIVNLTDTTYIFKEILAPSLTYYWRVRASDSLGLKTLSKETFKFTIGNLAPRPFSLLLPANDDTVFTTSPTLKWQPAIDPNQRDSISYTVYFSSDSAFLHSDTARGIKKTNFRLLKLHDHQSYFWKTEAYDNHGGRQNSRETFHFFTFAAPIPFDLISPGARFIATNDTIVFSWHSAFDPNSADIIRYIFLCDSSRLFSKPIMVSGISDTSFTLTDSLNNNTRYFWTVLAVDKDSFTTASSDTFSFLVRYLPTGVAGMEGLEIPTEFALSQNYPNPFNPTTTIHYQLPKATETRLEIFNLRGQRIATLVDRRQAAGYYDVIWDGKDDDGNPVASGCMFSGWRQGNLSR